MNAQYVKNNSNKSKSNFEELGWHFIHSSSFWQLFKQSSVVLSDTVDYLKKFEEDQPWPPLTELTHARDSILLTSRLIQLISWLFVHRAVRERKITLAQAYLDKNRIRITPLKENYSTHNNPSSAEMSELKERVEGLLRRVQKMDIALEKRVRGTYSKSNHVSEKTTFRNDVADEIAKLQQELDKNKTSK